MVIPVDLQSYEAGFISITQAFEKGTPGLIDCLKTAKRLCIVDRELGRVADVVVSPSLLRGLAKAILRDVPAELGVADKEL